MTVGYSKWSARPVRMLRAAGLALLLGLALWPAPANANEKAVGVVVIQDVAGRTLAVGPGVVVSPDGKVWANLHLLQGGYAGGHLRLGSRLIPLSGVARSQPNDNWVLLKTEARDLPVAPPLREGLAPGAPLKLLTVTGGKGEERVESRASQVKSWGPGQRLRFQGPTPAQGSVILDKDNRLVGLALFREDEVGVTADSMSQYLTEGLTEKPLSPVPPPQKVAPSQSTGSQSWLPNLVGSLGWLLVAYLLSLLFYWMSLGRGSPMSMSLLWSLFFYVILGLGWYYIWVGWAVTPNLLFWVGAVVAVILVVTLAWMGARRHAGEPALRQGGQR